MRPVPSPSTPQEWTGEKKGGKTIHTCPAHFSVENPKGAWKKKGGTKTFVSSCILEREDPEGVLYICKTKGGT